MPKKARTGIYHPPKSGMPYLVVTVTPDGVNTIAVATKDEARILASKKTLAVSVDNRTVAEQVRRADPS